MIVAVMLERPYGGLLLRAFGVHHYDLPCPLASKSDSVSSVRNTWRIVHFRTHDDDRGLIGNHAMCSHSSGALVRRSEVTGLKMRNCNSISAIGPAQSSLGIWVIPRYGHRFNEARGYRWGLWTRQGACPSCCDLGSWLSVKGTQGILVSQRSRIQRSGIGSGRAQYLPLYSIIAVAQDIDDFSFDP